MQCYYLSNNGIKIDFCKEYKMLAVNELLDFEWNYSTRGVTHKKLSRFVTDIKKKKCQIRIDTGGDYNSYADLCNNLVTACQYDISNVRPGKLYINDFYLECYILGTTKGTKYINTTSTTLSLIIVTEDNMWKRDSMYSFRKTDKHIEGGYDYEHDYNYDFVSDPTAKRSINIDSYTDTDFRIVIYGKTAYPTVYINDIEYTVYTVLPTDFDKLIIDTKNKLCYTETYEGDTTNVFNLRSRDNYIFSKLKAGNNVFRWSGDFDFDVYVQEERSEPLWQI